jgi:hypothetical protein
MIIWGGLYGEYAASYMNNGGIYKPVCPALFYPSTVPDGSQAGDNPLSVSLVGGLLHLEWDPACNATDYAVIAGDLSTLRDAGYNHTSLLCTTDGIPETIVNPAGNMLYFLIVPHNGTDEGSYGLDWQGNEHPPAASSCHAQNIGVCP